MPIENMDPPTAHAAMSAAGASVFVDVRTVAEYDAGHPEGAHNVPWAVRDPGSGQMTPNPAFLTTMERAFGKDSRLFVSCQMGGRSLGACRDLEAAGYASLVNVDGGFGGKRDPMGNVVVAGWAESGLPVSTDPSDYATLTGS